MAVSDRYTAFTLLQAASPIVLDTQDARQLERLQVCYIKGPCSMTFFARLVLE